MTHEDLEADSLTAALMFRSSTSHTEGTGPLVLPTTGPVAADVLRCALALGVWLGLTMAVRPLAVPDEGRYVGVAWEMLTSGNWVTPTLNGSPYFHKPPLFYWMTACAIKLFGPGMIAARVASWLAAVALGTGTFVFVRRWLDADVALRAVLIFATMPLLFGGAQFANLDMLVAACIGLCALAGAHALLADEAGSRAPWAGIAAFAMAGAGVLAKGLIGLALPGLVLVVWATATGRMRHLMRLMTSLPGWMLFCLMTAPWFIAMSRAFDGFIHYFFVVQHFQRFSGSSFNNVQPFWFYVPVLALGAFPWSGIGMARHKEAMRPTGSEASGLMALLVSWAACVVIFFSIPHSKLIGYALPSMAPLSVLIALSIRRWPMPKVWVATGTSAALCVAVVGAAAYLAPKSQAALATQLRQSMGSLDEVVFVDNHYFDVRYYARLSRPVLVVDRWSPHETAKDNWRRELMDAETFDPARESRLLHPQDLARRLCTGDRTVWILAPKGGGSLQWLANMPPTGESKDAALWRIDPSQPNDREAIGCSGLHQAIRR